MICDRCGRLLNRATGRCVCADYGGNAPPPVALTHPPPEEVRPISAAAALAVLDLNDRPATRSSATMSAQPPAPPPPPVTEAPLAVSSDGEFSVRIQRVDTASLATGRAVRIMAIAGVVALVLGIGGFAASRIFAAAPPPPPPPAPAPTVPPAERMARAELNQACPPWSAYAAGIPAGERPDPATLRPIVDGIRARFDAAAGAAPGYAPARDEVVYLQDYARRDADAVERESVSRVSYAISTISAACTRAAAG